MARSWSGALAGPSPTYRPSAMSVTTKVARVKPSAMHLMAASDRLGTARTIDHADQGKKPERGQQQVVAHGAVTGSVIRRSRAGRAWLVDQ